MTDPLGHTDNDRAHERLHNRIDAEAVALGSVRDRVSACETQTAKCRGEVETHMARMGAHLAQAGVQLTRTTEIVEQTTINIQAIEKTLVQVIGRMDSLAQREDDIMAIALEARSMSADIKEKAQSAIDHAANAKDIFKRIYSDSLMVVIGAILGAIIAPVLVKLF